MSELVGVEVEERGQAIVARLRGELDLAGVVSTREKITQGVPTSARGLVVDMTELDFIDSSGVAMVFALARRLSSRRQELHLAVRPEGPVARVLDIVGVSKAASVHAGLDEALGALGVVP
jgi:anti-anti-sigma factor